MGSHFEHECRDLQRIEKAIIDVIYVTYSTWNEHPKSVYDLACYMLNS